MSTLLALGLAARTCELEAAVAVLLDEIEALGGLALIDRHAQLRAELARIARVLATCWVERPELAAAEFYARTLDIPELAEVRLRWMAELDAHGPWARALRPIATDPALVAVLRDEQRWWQAQGPMVQFVSDHELELELPRPEDEPRRLSWTWTTAKLEAQPDRAPMVEPARDPRLEDGDPAPTFRRGWFRRATALDWPEDGRADAKLSRDGRSIFAYGWRDEGGGGLLRVFDAASLKIREAHEFESQVFDVIEGPTPGELLVQTCADIRIFGRAAPWLLEGSAWRIAWSPSGRYLCTLASGVIEVWDTQESPTRRRPLHRLPLRFADDGARLIDGAELVDARSGAHMATLEPCFGNYLVGGPRERWLYVGSELIAVTHGGLQLWDARTGAVVEPGSANRNLDRALKAYSRSGRVLALAKMSRTTVELVELPSLESLATIEVGLQVFQIAMSADAELIAVASQNELEVWGRDGTLRHHAAITGESNDLREAMGAKLQFSLDARQIEYSCARCEALVWTLDGEQLGPPRHVHRQPIPGWTAESGPVTVFVDDRGRRIALPLDGPWRVNPRNERIIACPGGLFELRGV